MGKKIIYNMIFQQDSRYFYYSSSYIDILRLMPCMTVGEAILNFSATSHQGFPNYYFIEQSFK